MKTSQNGIDLIKHFESLSLAAYDDGTGVWTVGWGHTGPDIEPGLTISASEAERLLADDIADAEAVVNHFGNLGIALDGKQWHYDALVSLAFNCGDKPFRKGTGLHDALERGSLAEVPAQIRRWTHAGGKVMPGLVRRREAEARLWETGDWREAPAPAPTAQRTLRRGDCGPDVAALQEALRRLGFEAIHVDGRFGLGTEAAVEQVQAAHYLTTDGAVGPKTRSAIAKALGEEGQP